ncbi:MAG: response regulator [Magnetococcales bacterium]|nr:response regulator [Magnetococcales bacterium]
MINLRILLVDDDANMLAIYRHILGNIENSGDPAAHAILLQNGSYRPGHAGETFALTEVNQGLDGVEAVARSLIDGHPYAVAFVDVRMPPGINGIETAKRIRELDDRIHIVIVTSCSDHYVDEVQALLKHDVILAQKPLTHDEILQLARNACHAWSKSMADQVLIGDLYAKKSQDEFGSIMERLMSLEMRERGLAERERALDNREPVIIIERLSEQSSEDWTSLVE